MVLGAVLAIVLVGCCASGTYTTTPFQTRSTVARPASLYSHPSRWNVCVDRLNVDPLSVHDSVITATAVSIGSASAETSVGRRAYHDKTHDVYKYFGGQTRDSAWEDLASRQL